MKILAFSFYFPPHGGPGALRPLKMLKYVSEKGVEGTVVAAAESDYSVRDESLLAEIPESFKILRTSEGLDPLRFVRRKKSGVIHAPMSDYLFLPDNKIWWIHPASKLGILTEPKPDLVWATCPPYSAALAAMKTARRLDVPLALDFRDSWTKNPNRQKLTPIHRAINRRKARKAVSSASLITCTYDAVCREMRELAPNARIELLPNGYDPEDMPNEISEQSNDGPLKLFYLGTIYPDLNYPLPILQTMTELSDVTLTVAGRYPVRFEQNIKKLGLSDRVQLLGYLPHKKALQEAAQHDVMLLYIDNRPLNLGQITSKTYEYLGLGKPILACVPPEGEAANLLKAFQTTCLVPPEDNERTQKALKIMLGQKRDGELSKIAPPQEFTRQSQAARWAELVGDTV